MSENIFPLVLPCSIAQLLMQTLHCSKRENCRLKDSRKHHLCIEFCNYPASIASYIDYRLCSVADASQMGVDAANKAPICQTFSVSSTSIFYVIEPFNSLLGMLLRRRFASLLLWQPLDCSGHKRSILVSCAILGNKSLF